MLGSGLDFKLKTRITSVSYPIVKDVFVMDALHLTNWVPISSIEFKDSRTSNLESSGMFTLKKNISLNSLKSNPDFEYKPFKTSNTMGLQRVEYPND